LALALLAGPAAARASDPLYIGWPDLLPGATLPYDPAGAKICQRGDVKCVQKLVETMRKAFGTLASRCDHDAVFSLSYLRTTEKYLQTVTNDPKFFHDTRFVNHEDVLFASLYFRAYDDWHAGRTSRVPAAWRIAFDAADRRRVSGAGDLLLGMNAHVNRDLPFALYQIGLHHRDGTSLKGDHDKVNRILQRVAGPVIREASRRFDPTIGGMQVNGTTLDETGLFQLLASWRESAWRSAERLALARTDAARALVAESIERSAATIATSIVAATAYVPPATTTAARDAYCKANWRG
jgi:hypothetical protein